MNNADPSLKWGITSNSPVLSVTLCSAPGRLFHRNDDGTADAAVIGRSQRGLAAAALLHQREDPAAVVAVHLPVLQPERLAVQRLHRAMKQRKRRSQPAGHVLH